MLLIVVYRESLYTLDDISIRPRDNRDSTVYAMGIKIIFTSALTGKLSSPPLKPQNGKRCIDISNTNIR